MKLSLSMSNPELSPDEIAAVNIAVESAENCMLVDLRGPKEISDANDAVKGRCL